MNDKLRIEILEGNCTDDEFGCAICDEPCDSDNEIWISAPQKGPLLICPGCFDGIFEADTQFLNLLSDRALVLSQRAEVLYWLAGAIATDSDDLTIESELGSSK